MSAQRTYIYSWRNNCKRLTLWGRLCVVLARSGYAGNGRRWNSRLVRFVDNGQIEVVSGNSLRRVLTYGP